MKGRRYSTEQNIRILRAADAGQPIIDACREEGISEQRFHHWKHELGMLEVDQAKQLKELQNEIARFIRMLEDEILGKELLKEALKKDYKFCTQTRAGATVCVARQIFGAWGVPTPWSAPFNLWLAPERAQALGGQAAQSGQSQESRAPGAGLPEDNPRRRVAAERASPLACRAKPGARTTSGHATSS